MGHRTVMKTLAVMLLVGLVMGGTALAADTIKVGLVTHKTGGLATASKVTGFPNVELWVHKVNARGGLKVDGTRKKIELIVYDDKGTIISAKEWNLATGQTATLGIIKK